MLIRKSLVTAASLLLFVPYSQSIDYRSVVLSDNPLAYYRFGDARPADMATNTGSLGAIGNGTYRHDNAAQTTIRRVTGALQGNGNAAAGFQSSDGAPVLVPYNAALNPSGAFTIEAWVKPTQATDDAVGPCPLFNRKSAGARQGWAFFQRSPTSGWNLRMYGNGVDSGVTLGLTGGSYTVDEWVHLAATYNGTTGVLYVNGTQVASGNPTAYQGNTTAAFAIGSYSDLLGSGPAYQNPFFGDVDEVALYSTALSAAQILAHYQNGTNALRSTPYETLVATDGAVEYLKLNEADVTIDTAMNTGKLGPAADGLHFPGPGHQAAGAIVGDSDTAASYSAIDSNSTDGGVPTIVPYNPTLNPSGSFTIEAWLKPTIPTASNQQCPLYDRITANSPFTDRAGWDVFQQPSGWRFRMFNGSGGNTVFNLTAAYLAVGSWQHFVAVYDATVPSLTLYTNGVQAAQSTTPSGTYAPNPSGPFAIGGFPLYSNGHFENPFTGSIDEVAIYTNALSSGQILAHFQNATNALRGTTYDALVLSHNPAGYWRLSEPARNIAANSGTLAAAANGTYASVTNAINNQVDIVCFSTPNSVTGPQFPAYAGFESTNAAAYFSGTTNYVELVNPAGLNFSGPITLEAWVLPQPSQGSESYFVAHGYNDDGTAEDVLRIENNMYYSGSYNGANHFAAFNVPSIDLLGANWVHVAGVYDGSQWRIYRNGALGASNADGIGALPVNNANWAVGARGRWKYATGLDRLFSGSIDEPAIYNVALSPARIRAHYFAGRYGTLTPPAPTLTITPDNAGNVILTWSDGVLQEANVVTGGYTDLLEATSPYSVPAVDAQKFFRVRL